MITELNDVPIELEAYRQQAIEQISGKDAELGEAFSIEENMLPALPSTVVARGLRALLGTKNYYKHQPSQRVEFLLTQECAQGLALVIIAQLLDAKSSVIHVPCETSGSAPPHLTEIRMIMIHKNEAPLSDTGGLSLRPSRFHYAFQERARNPLRTGPMPHICIADADHTFSQNAPCNVVHGFGDYAGSAAFAAVLLDIARSDEGAREYDFEGAYGFGGVAPGSAEIKIWLPGSIGWELYSC